MEKKILNVLLKTSMGFAVIPAGQTQDIEKLENESIKTNVYESMNSLADASKNEAYYLKLSALDDGDSKTSLNDYAKEKGYTTNATYLPDNSLVNSLERSFEFDPVINTE